VSRPAFVVLFYGLPLAGKRTTLRFLEGALNPTAARTDFGEAAGPAYDELPIRAGETPVLLRALSYSAALRDGGYADYRRAQARLLAEAHAVVLVLDGQVERTDANVEMATHLREDLDARGLDVDSLPIVQQQNKSDLPNFRGGAALAEAVGLEDLPWVRTCAATGDGVLDVLKAISRPLLAR
jgi:hypothetical protein